MRVFYTYKTLANQAYTDLPGGGRLPLVGLGTWKIDPGQQITLLVAIFPVHDVCMNDHAYVYVYK